MIGRHKEGFTCWFASNTKSIDGNPFDMDTPFGKVETIGLGNAFEERDVLEAAIQEIVRQWGHISELEEFCQAVLDGGWQPPEETD